LATIAITVAAVLANNKIN